MTDDLFFPTMPKSMISTHSALQRWWLTNFKGYRVFETRRSPVLTNTGRIVYKTEYILEPQRGAKPN